MHRTPAPRRRCCHTGQHASTQGSTPAHRAARQHTGQTPAHRAERRHTGQNAGTLGRTPAHWADASTQGRRQHTGQTPAQVRCIQINNIVEFF